MRTPEGLNNAETEEISHLLQQLKPSVGGVVALQEAALTEDLCTHGKDN